MSEKQLQKFIKKATKLSLALILLFIGACEASNPSTLQSTEGAVPKQVRNIGSQSSEQAQKQRVALVIGNSNYDLQDAFLSNPANDASGVGDALESEGFKVILLLNQNLKDMHNAIATFKQQLSQGGVGVFYYAGHGVQVEGENYLIPTDANLESQNDVHYEALALGEVVNAMNESGTRVNVIMIDACRNNPFSRHWHLSNRSSFTARGLASYDANTLPEGLIISYATAPNDVAADGEGRNSPYTASILKYIKIPNLDIAQMFRDVRNDVRRTTKNKQTPWYEESLTGSFSFNTTTKSSSPPIQPKLNSPTNDASQYITILVCIIVILVAILVGFGMLAVGM